MWRNKLATLPQYLVPQHVLSRAMGFFGYNRTVWFKNIFIKWFIRRYDVDMSLAKQPDPTAYEHFNAFFTRELKSGVRPLAGDDTVPVCPVDGAISQLGSIENGRIFQAKGFDFSVEQLLGGHRERAQAFLGGQFATIYLAPKDYHRVHMPLAGTLKEMVYIPGRLFSVNTRTTDTVPGLFARNERVACIFDTARGPMAVVLVGAMIVASIATAWRGLVAPSNSQTIETWTYPEPPHPSSVQLARGSELGYFAMGSTAIVLFADNKLAWSQLMKAGADVRLGQAIETVESAVLV